MAMSQEMCQAQQGSDPNNFYSDLTNFEIEKKIGRGQFSVVYRARCLVNDTIVAFKKVQVMECGMGREA